MEQGGPALVQRYLFLSKSDNHMRPFSSTMSRCHFAHWRSGALGLRPCRRSSATACISLSVMLRRMAEGPVRYVYAARCRSETSTGTRVMAPAAMDDEVVSMYPPRMANAGMMMSLSEMSL